MKTDRRGFNLLVILLALVIVVAVGGYLWYRIYAQRSPQGSGEEVQSDSTTGWKTYTNVPTTTGWKTYTNAAYKYRVKYPSDFYLHLIGYTPRPPYAVRFANYPSNSPNSDYVYFEIDTTPITMPTPLDQFPELLNLVSEGYTKAELTVDTQRAVRVTKPQVGLSAVVYFIKEDNSFRLALTSASAILGEASLDDFELFVNSLEFY